MIHLKISGMSCQHCVKAVRDALEQTPGVTGVPSLELETGMAEIDGDVKAEELISAVQQAGYTAEQA